MNTYLYTYGMEIIAISVKYRFPIQKSRQYSRWYLSYRANEIFSTLNGWSMLKSAEILREELQQKITNNYFETQEVMEIRYSDKTLNKFFQISFLFKNVD